MASRDARYNLRATRVDEASRRGQLQILKGLLALRVSRPAARGTRPYTVDCFVHAMKGTSQRCMAAHCMAMASVCWLHTADQRRPPQLTHHDDAVTTSAPTSLEAHAVDIWTWTAPPMPPPSNIAPHKQAGETEESDQSRSNATDGAAHTPGFLGQDILSLQSPSLRYVRDRDWRDLWRTVISTLPTATLENYLIARDWRIYCSVSHRSLCAPHPSHARHTHTHRQASRRSRTPIWTRALLCLLGLRPLPQRKNAANRC